MYDYPYLRRDTCPVCDVALVAVVDISVGTPRATGGRMEVPLEEVVTWFAACEHLGIGDGPGLW